MRSKLKMYITSLIAIIIIIATVFCIRNLLFSKNSSTSSSDIVSTEDSDNLIIGDSSDSNALNVFIDSDLDSNSITDNENYPVSEWNNQIENYLNSTFLKQKSGIAKEDCNGDTEGKNQQKVPTGVRNVGEDNIKELNEGEVTNQSNIWIVGDSTVSSFNDNYYYPRYGWGTQIGNYLDGSFSIQNLALSGRSSKSFTVEPQYSTLLKGMKSGDYLLVGFGHNDEKTEVERYTNPNGTYLDEGSFANSLYKNYIKPAKEAGCKVILCTPIVRRTETGEWSGTNIHITEDFGEFVGGDYSKAIKVLGKTLNIPVVDMTSLTKSLYDKLGPNETLNLHAWTSSKAVSVDNTHTNIWGAKYNAYFITKAIKELRIAGISEHVIETNAPIKKDSLFSNPDYKTSSYTGKLKQSILWKDYGIWKGTVFGDIGVDANIENQVIEKDSEGNMHIAVSNNKGKIASTSDGIAMYYYKVPVNSKFTLTAKAKINKLVLNDQVSFGLMARDEMYVDYNTMEALGDYVVAGPLKLTKAGNVWNCFARKNGGLTQGGTCKNPISAGDTVNLSIQSNSDGYACTFGNETTITGGFDFKLTSIDPNYVYVGMFVARNADITYSDIKLVVDGVEVKS
ncbi:carbohydrate esterase family 12 protein [Clostridium sp. SHJSY1]|uniref:GDSL-type esterase/lipase family protein n=1 Tax=Clostridium sp. SHJSY1 TaxID=2942483 RepID=UPI00287408DD|nr:GDSL-type esterase/lipase family protein [Clostridium sp. SHJSY1]MDS0526321.1 carbohydrate esterase family 12 protein [Clostridium sp. SHJSY1]